MIPVTPTVWDGTNERACTLTVWIADTASLMIAPAQQNLTIEPTAASTDDNVTTNDQAVGSTEP